MRSVLLTDHPWLDDGLERGIIEAAGLQFHIGPEVAPDAGAVEQFVRQLDPVAILTCWAQVSGDAIRSCSRLKHVGRLGVGLDNIDVAAATASGAWVTNVPDYCVGEVSDHAIAMLLDYCRGITRLNTQSKSKGWHSDTSGLLRVADQVVGIIGYGKIGRETARKLRAFGCRILANAPSMQADDDYAEHASLDRLKAEATVIIIHAPFLPATHNLVDQQFIEGLARKPFLINVSRGQLVSNEALLEGLRSGALAGAGLDVVAGEPNPPSAIIDHPAVVVTPHVAYGSGASMVEMRRRACEETVRVLTGQAPEHPCNTPA